MRERTGPRVFQILWNGHGRGYDESHSLDPAIYSAADIIEKDVVIIGGGSSGSFTAVRLRDFNKSVVVIEKSGTLGGHAETYTNPFTGYTTDLGVVVFHNLQVVLNYFAKFDTPLFKISPFVTNLSYVDFTTGQPVDFKPPNAEAFTIALKSYSRHLERHAGIHLGFNLSYPVDPDLLLSFKDFVEKYGLQDLVALTLLSNQGFAPILDISMLYIFKYLNIYQVRGYLESSLLTTAHHNIQELYTKIAHFLGSDALLNTRRQPIHVLVQTPVGRKLILAKALVSAVPPVVDGLTGFDLSDEERKLFGKFHANGYYTGLLNNTGLNESIWNIGPGRAYSIPALPGPYGMALTAEGLTQVYYVKADVISHVKAVQHARGIVTDGSEPSWLAFSSHSPFNLMVSNDDIKQRF
ncbi:amine oxidase, flavin-containing superfamily [Xylaria digitata]|nr:amine oxidase, flavin-containing superfamily [Xylaria digitata]